MRISVNLATRPFVELRPFFLRLRIIMASLALLTVALWLTAHMLQQKVDRQQEQLNIVKAQTVAVQTERQRNEARMHQPQNQEVLNRAHFLNSLFLRKSFSWTAVMMDLETVLPVGVQVTSIEPQVAADGSVAIRLRVGGDRDRAVQLLRNLEHSRRFLQPRLSAEVSQAKEGQQGGATTAGANGVPGALPGVEFDILAIYNPLPEGESYPRVKAVRAPQPTGVPAATTTPRAASPTFDTSGRHGVVLKPYQPNNAVPAPATAPRVPAGRQP